MNFLDNKIKTFSEQDLLPSLPIPSLELTIFKYLDSLKPHLSPDEFQSASDIILAFKNGIGRDLHESFSEKAKLERNWLEKLWYDKAYLEFRSPLCPYFNIAGGVMSIESTQSPCKTTQLKNAAFCVFAHIHHWCSMRNQNLKIDRKNSGQPLCMNQYRNLYNAYQEPKFHKDVLHTDFKTIDEGDCDSDVIVIHKGRLFIMKTMYDEHQISLSTLEKQLESIMNACEKSNSQSLGFLTTEDRSLWAKNYKHLKNLHPNNEANIQKIAKSVMIIVLESVCPKNLSEMFSLCLKGNPLNRWCDKGASDIIFSNGMVGSNLTHVGFDGITFLNAFAYMEDLSKGLNENELNVSTNYSNPNELIFTLDLSIQNALHRATSHFEAAASNVNAIVEIFELFGKQLMRSYKLHPDAFVQLALQMTYYHLHQECAPTYETGSLRNYWHGRTETVRSCTDEAITWVKSMFDENTSISHRYRLLKIAEQNHCRLLLEASEMKGCDRHLLALRTLAKDKGFEDPEIFTDASWHKSGGDGNFRLSTSTLGYTKDIGGVSAMCENGYGVFYSIHDKKISFVMSTYESSLKTDIEKFKSTLNSTLISMKYLCDAHKKEYASKL